MAMKINNTKKLRKQMEEKETKRRAGFLSPGQLSEDEDGIAR